MSSQAEKSLPFDMAERLAALEAGIESIAPGNGADTRLLDVGGAPGLFARHLQRRHPTWKIAIADLYECRADRYVLGSGLALPFQNGAIDVAYCCDVLEHVPETVRPRFLSEMKRVARIGLIVAAPFRQPNVDRAEAILDGLHKDLLGERHPWLREHRDNGLPDLAATAEDLGKSTSSITLTPNADLERWFLLQAIEILSQVLPGAREAWRTFQEPLGALWNDPSSPIPSVPYRWVLAANLPDNRAGGEPVGSTITAALDPRRGPGSSTPNSKVDGAAAPDAYPFSASLDARFEALAALARSLAAGWQAFAGGGDAGETVSDSQGVGSGVSQGKATGNATGGSMAQRELIDRLTSTIEFLESKSPGSASGETSRSSFTPTSFLRKVLRRLRGRG